MAEFNADECYDLFIAVDDQCRHYRGRHKAFNELREKLLPFYSQWHAEHPFKVHPRSVAEYTAEIGR